MSWSKGKTHWVGRHKNYGLYVVEAGELRAEGTWIEAFVVAPARFAKFDRQMLRELTDDKRINSSDISDSVEALLFIREVEYEREIKDKHKKFLKREGMSLADIRKRTGVKPARQAHCYSCKNVLDSLVDYECIACDWIVCECGACGCSYNR